VDAREDWLSAAQGDAMSQQWWRVSGSVAAHCRAIGAAVVLGLTFAGGLLLMVDTRASDVRAQDWARSASVRGRLPVSFDAVQRLTRDYRRAAFLEMTPAQRSGLWQEQYARFAAAGLSIEQRALVLEYRALLTPELYDLANPEREVLARATLGYCATFAALFTAQQRTALTRIGATAAPSTDGRLVRLARLFRSALGLVVVNAGSQGDCDCSQDVERCECGVSSGLVCKPLECTETILNCGCGGAAVHCTRKCSSPGPAK